MTEVDFVAGLRQRLMQIEAEMQTLREEQAHVQWLVTRYSQRHPVITDRPPPDLSRVAEGGLTLLLRDRTYDPRPLAKRSALGPDPNSKTSRILSLSRAYLDQRDTKEASFMEIYQSLPDDLRGGGRNSRELARNALIANGDRVGVEYISAERVRALA